MIIYYNDKIYKETEIPEFALDRGLFFGDGVFESMHSRSGKILGLDLHIQRLFSGLKVLKIEHSWTENELKKNINKVIAESAFPDVYIRINATRGKWLGSVPPVITAKPNLIVVARQFLPFKEELYQRGFRAMILPTRRNETSPLCQIKSLNYLDNILSRMLALDKDFDEGIYLNTKGFLVEGTANNLFLIKKGVLLTPPAKDGALPGITRQIILEKAPHLGLKVKEQSLLPEEIYNTEEAFLTNSSMGVVPLVELDGKPIGTGHLTQKIRTFYEGIHES